MLYFCHVTTTWRKVRKKKKEYIPFLIFKLSSECVSLYIVYSYVYNLHVAPDRLNYDPRGHGTKIRAGPKCLAKHYVKTLTRKWNVQHQSAYEDGDQTSLHTPASGSAWTASLFSSSFSSFFFLSFLIPLPFSPSYSSTRHSIPLAHCFHHDGTQPRFCWR